ncbi:MAG: M1 family metallopeptidase [Gemmatimonadota bacterium]|nr:MAG: M1 family metallopeptidase [Gemmatimonadota bacterium]
MPPLKHHATLLLLLSTLLPLLGDGALAQSEGGAVRALERPVPNPIVPSLEYRRALANGTRTTEGVPGPNYWQQSAHYTIAARLDVAEKRLEGTTRILYRNASPDTLPRLVVQLIQNFHREDAPRTFGAEITGGYTLTRVVAGGEALEEAQRPNTPGYVMRQTNLYIVPPAPVAPGDSVVLELEWSFKIPQNGASGRMGWNSDDFFYLAYWYPQMAVYDDVVGWQADPFTGLAEFYSGFAQYDVTLDVPEGWLVQGTGRLLNEREVLPDPVIARLRQAEVSDTVVHVITEQDFGPGSATRRGPDGRLRWHFVADSVRDAAYAITRASRWDVVRTDVGDRDGDGRPEYARAEAIYRPRYERWHQVARYAQHSIAFLSRHTGLPYPYPHATAVEGDGIIGGGMEYPMMTLIGGYQRQSDTSMYAVTAHELAHNWLPMIVSIDERRRAWMDEGTTNFNDDAASADFFPGYDSEPFEFSGYTRQANTGHEGALMRYSDRLDTPQHYGVHGYNKPASLLISLRNMLGAETFFRAYRGYIRTWAYKQPKPWDFFNYFNAATGQDLSWFWRSWYYETWTLDQSIASVTPRRDGTEIVVYDRGDVPMPARLTITLANGDTLEREIPVTTWLSGTRTATVTVPGGQAVTQVEIDAQREFPDVMRKNNRWTAAADALLPSLPLAVRNDLARQRADLLEQGYRPDGRALSGSVSRGGSGFERLTLEGGVEYAILAACDGECYDIDLVLADAADSTVAEDQRGDDVPVLTFTAPETGSYRLETVMFSCRMNACTWGGEVLRR